MLGALLVFLVASSVASQFAILIAGDPTSIGGSWFYNIVFFTLFIGSSIAGNIGLRFIDFFTNVPIVEEYKKWGGLGIGLLLGLFIAGLVSIVLTRFPLWDDLDQATTDSSLAEVSSKFSLIAYPLLPGELQNAYNLIADNQTLEEQEEEEDDESDNEQEDQEESQSDS